MAASAAKASGWSLPRWEVAVCVSGVALSFWIAEYLAVEKSIDIGGKREMTYYNYIQGSIPLYLALISLELLVLYVHRRRLPINEVDWIPESGYHEVADSWSSIAAGSMDIIFAVMFIERFPLKTYVYEYLYQNYAVGELDLAWAPHWVRLIVFGALIELCYYWFHRVSHENGLIWAMGHANHHSSEHYNFSTALRQGYLQQAVSWVFYLPLAVLGVPTDMSMTYRSWNIMYQFWVHSSIIGFLPWPLDDIFMTPSNHRIHHDRRFHKNFGGTLVVYDRLFGTYLKEPTPTACVYGWTIPAKSWKDSVLQLDVFARQARSWWRGPGYYTTTVYRICPTIPRLPRITRHTTVSSGIKWYIVAQFLLSTVCGLLFIRSNDNVLAAYSIFSYISQGSLFDGNKKYEYLRCAVFALVGLAYGGTIGAFCLLWCLGSPGCLYVLS